MFQKQQQNTATSAQYNNIIHLDEKRREKNTHTHKKHQQQKPGKYIYREKRKN